MAAKVVFNASWMLIQLSTSVLSQSKRTARGHLAVSRREFGLVTIGETFVKFRNRTCCRSRMAIANWAAINLDYRHDI